MTCYCRMLAYVVMKEEEAWLTYFTRSKTVTLFPTGEYRCSPSGLKRRLPWQYTVPKRLENSGECQYKYSCMRRRYLLP